MRTHQEETVRSGRPQQVAAVAEAARARASHVKMPEGAAAEAAAQKDVKKK